MGLLFGGRKEAPSSRSAWSPVRSSDLASCGSWTHEAAPCLPCTPIGSLSQRPLHCIKSTTLTPKASLCGPRAAYSGKEGQKLPSLVASSKCEDTGADLPQSPSPDLMRPPGHTQKWTRKLSLLKKLPSCWSFWNSGSSKFR